MTDTDRPNLQLVKAAYAAFASNDIDAFAASLHPEVEWHEAEHSPWHAPGGHHGPGDVLANVFARIPADFERFEVVPHRFLDAGATIVVECRYLATGTSPSDRLDAQACHLWTVRDGKLARFQQYTDTWQFAQATGARR